MAYTSSGRLPIERASKIGHVKIIQEPHIQRLIEAFEQVDTRRDEALGELSGTLDLTQIGELENVVAIDGSHVALPNEVHNYKRVAFVTAGAVLLTRHEVADMKAHPIIDPRDLARQMERNAQTMASVLPLSGVVIPGETVVESIRRIVDETLHYHDLYTTLRFLISREWLTDYSMQEHMACVRCGREFVLPRSTLTFTCPHCRHVHHLSDYLTLTQEEPDDWAKEQTASDLRTVLETLLLMRFLMLYRDRPVVLRRTLFVKDGPLLLHAQLSRLVEPIRAYLKHLHDQGRELHIVGIEKTGDLVEHTPMIQRVLVYAGDYFLPSVRYLHERIQGVPYIASEYRNRVQYGSKVVVRLGPDHVVACNVPTGDFLTDPSVEDLYGFQQSMALLSEMLSYAHENALIPLVLANQQASISVTPSGNILEAFARKFLGE